MTQSAIQPAFDDAARESQAVFRAVMDAMTRPGRILRLAAGFTPPAPLNPAAAAILIALADFETSVWLDAELSEQAAVADFMRFHTGAKLVAAPEAASFALIVDVAGAPPLAAFAQGTPDYPDLSATIIFQVDRLTLDGWTLAGPGIDGQTGFGASPLPEKFERQLAENRSRFPLGVDVIFAGHGEIAALPRSTRIVEAR